MLLFDHFPSADSKTWRTLIEKELRGKPYRNLCYTGPEGIEIQPDIPLDAGHNPMFSHRYSSAGWTAVARITGADSAEVVSQCMKALEAGAQALYMQSESAMWAIQSRKWNTATKFFLCDIPDNPGQFSNYSGALCFDPIVWAAAAGNELDATSLYAYLQDLQPLLPEFSCIYADGAFWHEAGTDHLTQLALITATLHEAMCTSGLEWSKVCAGLTAGRDFFMSVAAFRALRLLHARLVELHGSNQSATLQIHGFTSQLHMAVNDRHNNLLRAAGQGMAAVLGGADALCIFPFDAPDSTALGCRLALNAQHLLRHEGHLDKVSDPLKGSALAEQLTQQLAAGAWQLFREIERAGGIVAWHNSGALAARILKDRSRVMIAYQEMLGVTLFPFPSDLPDTAHPLPDPDQPRKVMPIRLSDHIKTEA